MFKQTFGIATALEVEFWHGPAGLNEGCFIFLFVKIVIQFLNTQAMSLLKGKWAKRKGAACVIPPWASLLWFSRFSEGVVSFSPLVLWTFAALCCTYTLSSIQPPRARSHFTSFLLYPLWLICHKNGFNIGFAFTPLSLFSCLFQTLAGS